MLLGNLKTLIPGLWPFCCLFLQVVWEFFQTVTLPHSTVWLTMDFSSKFSQCSFPSNVVPFVNPEGCSEPVALCGPNMWPFLNPLPLPIHPSGWGVHLLPLSALLHFNYLSPRLPFGRPSLTVGSVHSLAPFSSQFIICSGKNLYYFPHSQGNDWVLLTKTTTEVTAGPNFYSLILCHWEKMKESVHLTFCTLKTMHWSVITKQWALGVE